MKKRDEFTDPTSCLNRAHDDEYLFVLLSRDPAAPAAIRHWISVRINLGKNKLTDPQIVEAFAAANRMEAERRERGVADAIAVLEQATDAHGVADAVAVLEQATDAHGVADAIAVLEQATDAP